MSESMEENIYLKLMAFADGELAEEEMRDLLRYLAEHPEMLGTIRDHRHLTVAIARMTRDAAPEVPAELREKINTLRGTSDAVSRRRAVGAVSRKTFSRALAGLAAAAALILGILVGHYSARVPTQATESGVSALVVPASMVAAVSRIHADCSRLADALHSAGFPKAENELAGAVEEDLSTDQPHPDLSSAGYRYVGAGPCGETLPNTVHLLYRSMKPGSRHAVSVFVQTNDQQIPMEPGRLYSLSVAQSPFPIVAWRSERVTYFLLADDAQTLWKVLGIIKGAPRSLGTL